MSSVWQWEVVLSPCLYWIYISATESKLNFVTQKCKTLILLCSSLEGWFLRMSALEKKNIKIFIDIADQFKEYLSSRYLHSWRSLYIVYIIKTWSKISYDSSFCSAFKVWHEFNWRRFQVNFKQLCPPPPRVWAPAPQKKINTRVHYQQCSCSPPGVRIFSVFCK